jgi:ABC-type uncharacterized transport system permease subunit
VVTFDVALLLLFATPVALAAIGETIHQRAGLLNVGLEGMMLSGALAATLATHASGNPWLGLLAGIGAGLTMGALQSFFAIQLGQDQVVIGTATNLLSLGLTSTLFGVIFGRSGQLLSLAPLPKFLGIDAVVVLTLALTAWLVWLMGRTGWGLAVRAAGEKPEAVAAAGFNVASLRWQAALFGAGLAGLGGAHLAVGVSGSFAENMTQGRGFVALALVTFGRWRTPWVLAGTLLVGFAESLRFSLQAQGATVPPQALIALPYVLALVVLVFAGKGGRPPVALGIPYRSR